ncbi:MAG TPA: hypothetical protein VHS31_06945 [Tepidisphaeraceae bacterium]|nr:hypothetical protein [Tepidisphaeraceae bacterium]
MLIVEGGLEGLSQLGGGVEMIFVDRADSCMVVQAGVFWGSIVGRGWSSIGTEALREKGWFCATCWAEMLWGAGEGEKNFWGRDFGVGGRCAG